MRTLLDSNNLSYFKILDSQEFSIDENKVTYDGCIHPDLNSNNCTVIEISSFPDNWKHARFKYENETFTQVNFEVGEIPNE